MTTLPFEADVIAQPNGLAVIDAAIVGVAMMDEAEAREYLKMMQWDLEAADSALTNFRARALDFAEREGWRALGYAGALEALQTELGAQHSKSYLSRILQAGEIERVLDLPIGQLPERTLRPLAQLDTPDQQRAAFKAVEGKPTATKVQQAVDQIKPTAQALPPAKADIPKTVAELDAIWMPVDLHNAGYYWHAAAPLTIANNNGWKGDAPTIDSALELARLHKDARTKPVAVFPLLNHMECKALIREAALFAKAGGDRRFPTLWQALAAATTRALEVLEGK